MVAEAKAVIHRVDTLRSRVRGLLDGLESEVLLVIDCMYPSDQLLAALHDFHAAFPTVPLRLSVQAPDGVERVVRNGDPWIGVGGVLHIDMTGLKRVQIGAVQIIPVAAPDHPLALADNKSPSSASDHVQLVLSDQPTPGPRDVGVVSLTNWRVGDMTLKHKLLVAGTGLGRNAGAGRSRRSAGGKVGATGPARLARRSLRDAGGVQDRNAAWSCRPVADRASGAFVAGVRQSILAQSGQGQRHSTTASMLDPFSRGEDARIMPCERKRGNACPSESLQV